MSIHYGWTLPKGPRPKPPQPKLGEIGPSQDFTTLQRKRSKTKKGTTKQTSSNQGSQQQQPTAQQQTPTTKKRKKPKPERSKQNTPVRVEIVRPARPALPSALAKSSRVVVEWRRGDRRYLAWGKRGVKAVHGLRECSADTTFQQLLKKLHPIGTKLTITDPQIPVVVILDLMIATGKVLRPRPISTPAAPAAAQPSSPRPTQSRSRGVSRRKQPTSQRRSAAEEAARHEALVIRPSDGKPPKAARKRKTTSQGAKPAMNRRQRSAQQGKTSRRPRSVRRNGYDGRGAPTDLMQIALQGGSPGLKR